MYIEVAEAMASSQKNTNNQLLFSAPSIRQYSSFVILCVG